MQKNYTKTLFLYLLSVVIVGIAFLIKGGIKKKECKYTSDLILYKYDCYCFFKITTNYYGYK